MKTETVNDIQFTRIDSDVNGNPRYVCHFSNLLKDSENTDDISFKYATALARAKKIGGKKFHNKQYGGGIVFQSYNIRMLAEEIIELTK
jgi:hypothetical protein